MEGKTTSSRLSLAWIVVVVLFLFIILLVVLNFLNSLNKGGAAKTEPTPTTTNPFKETNPFDEEATYSNPFEDSNADKEYENPFQKLR